MSDGSSTAGAGSVARIRCGSTPLLSTKERMSATTRQETSFIGPSLPALVVARRLIIASPQPPSHGLIILLRENHLFRTDVLVEVLGADQTELQGGLFKGQMLGMG